MGAVDEGSDSFEITGGVLCIIVCCLVVLDDESQIRQISQL